MPFRGLTCTRPIAACVTLVIHPPLPPVDQAPSMCSNGAAHPLLQQKTRQNLPGGSLESLVPLRFSLVGPVGLEPTTR